MHNKNNRAFLSHSGLDKDFVAKVFELLGASNAHYDVRTFEPAATSANEILGALATSSVFVLFLSQHAMASAWVNREIEYASDLYLRGSLQRILIIPLDATPRNRLAVWLQPFVVPSLAAPALVTARIKSVLSSTARGTNVSAGRFLGRSVEVDSLKNQIQNLFSSPPAAVILTGVQGIGRRSIAHRIFRDLFPFVSEFWAEIELQSFEGEMDLYRTLLGYLQPNLTIGELRSLTDQFLAGDDTARTKAMTDLIREFETAKQVVLIRTQEALFDPEGNLVDWLSRLINQLPCTFPVLVILTTQHFGPRAAAKLIGIPCARVGSLSENDSKSLFDFLCQDLGLGLSENEKEQVLPSVAGHPGLIALSAKVIKAVGKDRFFLDLRRGNRLSSVEEYVEKIIRPYEIDARRTAALVFLDEIGGASREDLCVAMTDNEPDSFYSTLAELIDFGLAEEAGGLLCVPTYLRLQLRSWKQKEGVRELLIEARKRLLKLLEQEKSLDGAPYAPLRAVIATAIRTEGEYEHTLTKMPLFAPHQLRVARRLYDERQFARAMVLARSSYERRIALSDEATIEALRILGLCAVRRGDDGILHEVLSELGTREERRATRMRYFLRGFSFRVKRQYQNAERELRQALDCPGGHRDFSIVRELATVLLKLGRESEAAEYARKALDIARTNPYILDILIDALIHRLTVDGPSAALIHELDDLMGELRLADRRERTNFAMLRQSQLARAKGDVFTIERMLSEYRGRSADRWYIASEAWLLLRKGSPNEALKQVHRLEMEDLQDPEDRDLPDDRKEVLLLKLVAFCDAHRFDEAVSCWNQVRTLLSEHEASQVHRQCAHVAASTKVRMSARAAAWLKG